MQVKHGGPMSNSRSAGIVVYRWKEKRTIEVLLVHPGGPFWAKKDEHAWSVPKGEYAEYEDAEAAALREFQEELGSSPPSGPRTHLGEFRQPSGKVVCVWAVHGDFSTDNIVSNMFEMEWPRGSGQVRAFPEVDKAAWWSVASARTKLHKGQVQILDALVDVLSDSGEEVHEGVVAGQASLF